MSSPIAAAAMEATPKRQSSKAPSYGPQLKEVAMHSRRQLVTNMQVNGWSEEDILDTRRLIEYLEKLKFADDFVRFLKDKSEAARLKTLRFLGCWKPLQELQAAQHQRPMPLFIYALSPGALEPVLLFDQSGTEVITDTEGFPNRADCLLYDRESREMKAYNDSGCETRMFSVLHIRSCISVLNVKTRNKNNKAAPKRTDLSRTQEKTFHGAALFVDEHDHLIQECWVRSKSGCSIENVMVVDIPPNVQKSWLPKWVAACRHMLPIERTKNLYVFLWKQTIVDTALGAAVANQVVHTYRCCYRSCVDAVARVAGLKSNTLAFCKSLENLCAAYEAELSDDILLQHVHTLDVDLMKRNLRELNQRGSSLKAWLNVNSTNMAELDRYATYRKHNMSKRLKRHLSERDRLNLDALLAVKRQRRTAEGELSFEDHTELTKARAVVAGKRGKAGRPRNSDRIELIRRYREQSGEF